MRNKILNAMAVKFVGMPTLTLVAADSTNYADVIDFDTYKQKGYAVTINYLKQLYRKNRITLMTKTQLVNTLTSVHMMNRKTRKKFLNAVK